MIVCNLHCVQTSLGTKYESQVTDQVTGQVTGHMPVIFEFTVCSHYFLGGGGGLAYFSNHVIYIT